MVNSSYQRICSVSTRLMTRFGIVPIARCQDLLDVVFSVWSPREIQGSPISVSDHRPSRLAIFGCPDRCASIRSDDDDQALIRGLVTAFSIFVVVLLQSKDGREPRARPTATIAGVRIPIQVDIGFSDAVTPEPVDIESVVARCAGAALTKSSNRADIPGLRTGLRMM